MERGGMSGFLESFNGVFHGLMAWNQWERLIENLKARNDGGWFAYFVGQPVPQIPVPGEKFSRLLDEIDALLRRDHEGSYLGIVYVDDFDRPAMVKIFDPNHLGVSCGVSQGRILPGWILSRMPPEELTSDRLVDGGRKRWWEKIFS